DKMEVDAIVDACRGRRGAEWENNSLHSAQQRIGTAMLSADGAHGTVPSSTGIKPQPSAGLTSLSDRVRYCDCILGRVGQRSAGKSSVAAVRLCSGTPSACASIS